MPEQAQKHPQQNDPKKLASNKDAPPADPELRNEGEGSRSGARRYDEHAANAAKDEKKVKELAEQARKALEGPEGEKLRQAEERGKNAKHR